MFTDDELKDLCQMVDFLSKVFSSQRLAQAFGRSDSDMDALIAKAAEYLNQDPRKPTAEIYGVIAHFIKENGENLLNDEGVDSKVAQQWTEQIMNEITVRFELVDHETYKRLVSIVTQKKA